MAGDWIKFRKKLLRDGRVMELSRLCHAARVTVIGALVTLWSLADEYAEENGCLPGYTIADLNAEIGVQNFCESLPKEWFSLGEDGRIYLPNYHQHNGLTAKKRDQAARRQASRRKRDNTVTLPSRSSHAPCVTREEKRREEKKEDKPPFPPCLDCDEFREVWTAWIAHRKEIKKPLTPTSIGQQLRKLSEWGLSRAIEAIRHSIANGWQGIFEPPSNRVLNRQSNRDETILKQIQEATSDDSPD